MLALRQLPQKGAHLLGVDEETIRRWARDDTPVPRGIVLALEAKAETEFFARELMALTLS